MKRLLLLVGILLGLAVPASAQASNYWGRWSMFDGGLNCCVESTPTNTGQHIYYPGCQEHVTVPIGATRWVNLYYYQGYGAWVGPFHFHGLQWASITSNTTTRFHDTENANHNGPDERAVVGTRSFAYATDKYGIQHTNVMKIVNLGQLDITFTNLCS